MKRIFLGWHRPGMTGAVEHLAERFGRPGSLDFSGAILAVPGSRAARRLLELLLERADCTGDRFVPPQIVTLGHLPELLYAPKLPVASEPAARFAWAEALRRLEPDQLKRLLPSPPSSGELGPWLSLAETIERLHAEIASEGMSFGEIVRRTASLAEFRDGPRWRVLADAEQAYLAVLDSAGVTDRHAARLGALRENAVQTDWEIILLGAADLNRLTRRMLEQVAAQVTALVLAPPSFAHRFDDFGVLEADAWQEATIEISPQQIEVAERPSDQAAAAARAIQAWSEQFAAEEMTVGVPDASVVPYLQQHCEQMGTVGRYAGGAPVLRSSPCRLLAALADYLDGRRFSSFAAMVRHPAMQSWLARRKLRGDWMSLLDDYYCRHLPYTLDGNWLGPDEECKLLREIHAAIEKLVGTLSVGRRPLDAWASPLADLLVSLFGAETLDADAEPDRSTLVACESVGQVLETLRRIPRSLVPEVTGLETLRLVLRQLHRATIPPAASPGAIELLGWLELLLDDAPALAVAGMNEGIVPGSVSGDLFLPNTLRRQLGIDDNDRRYARDAYVLSALAASRERLKLIVGRRTTDGDPLAPSRLLFACDPETIAQRVLTLFGRDPERRPPVRGTLRPGCIVSRFSIPRPVPLPEPVSAMRVTEFRDYIACPYRYYLRHRLKLQSRQDHGDELDDGMFGSLAHAVLAEFAACDAAASTDAEVIAAHLDHLLDQLVLGWHGPSPLAAIRVQVEQLRLRLRAFARWQARWASRGWRIECAEAAAAQREAPLVVDGQPMLLVGRIDRIDVNLHTGQRVLLDYKTSDSPKDPERSHRRQGEWADLQLPLYRHLAASLGIDGPVRLGYLVLPKDTSKTGDLLAEWTDKELENADRAAEAVIRSVRAERFWPPVTPPPALFAEFSAICLEGQFGGEAIRQAAEEPA